MSRDQVVPETLFTFYWTAKHVSEVLAQDSPLLLPHDVALQAEEHFVHFSEMTKTGDRVGWIWLFRDRVEASRLRKMGLDPDFARFAPADARELIGATIPKGTAGLMEFAPSLLADIPTLSETVQEIWLGFDSMRLAKDRCLRSSAHDIFSVEEFLDRIDRRVV
jgi:hypothetical protein